jgi:hypothetical protein
MRKPEGGHMNTDVLIVGAGTTGLMLACWLKRLGIHPLVIDKKKGLTRESRALAVQARTLETYDLLGIVERPDLTFEEIRPEVERYSDMRVKETFWLSTYNVHHRVAHVFRRGRVFLLGDAGHLHSPVGGQGMNTGLMDATNLGWKLAAVLRGEADERLLASYEPERIPFARLLVNTTDRVFSTVATSSLWVRVLRSVVVPAVFTMIAWLPTVRRALFGLISQTRINYHDSPISQGAAGGVRAGDRLPWVKWSGDGNKDGSNYDSLRILSPQIQVYGAVSPEVVAWASQHAEFPLTRLPWTAEAARAGLQSGACYFLRPDGYVAYASTHFNRKEFLAFLRDAWGWRGARANRTGECFFGNVSQSTHECTYLRPNIMMVKRGLAETAWGAAPNRIGLRLG